MSLLFIFTVTLLSIYGFIIAELKTDPRLLNGQN